VASIFLFYVELLTIAAPSCCIGEREGEGKRAIGCGTAADGFRWMIE